MTLLFSSLGSDYMVALEFVILSAVFHILETLAPELNRTSGTQNPEHNQLLLKRIQFIGNMSLMRELPSPCSEIWIGDLSDYRYCLRLDREEYKSLIFYDYDSSSAARYLFYVIFEDERPHWRLLLRDGVFRCYDVINTGGEFDKIRYPGYTVVRDIAELSRLH